MAWSGKAPENQLGLFFKKFCRYDLPKRYQFGRKGRSFKRNAITVYPNCFHAVRDLTNFEFDKFPKSIKQKRIRVAKIQTLASGLKRAWLQHKKILTCGRIEISLFNLPADTDVLYLSKRMARSQLKKIQMMKVPVDDVIQNLDTVLQFPETVGDNNDKLSASDERELAILCNMCGLWDWRYKKYLVQNLYQESSSDNESTPKLLSKFQAEQKEELLTWYVGKRYAKKETRFCYRTWDSKGGKLVKKKRMVPRPNGSYPSAEEAAEAILTWAIACDAWSPTAPYDPEMKWIHDIGMLVRNSKPNNDR